MCIKCYKRIYYKLNHFYCFVFNKIINNNKIIKTVIVKDYLHLSTELTPIYSFNNLK